MSHRDHPATDWAGVVIGDSQLVDVREPREVAAGSLPGAVNIPLGELASRLAEIDRDRRVVLLCRSGNRSGQAAELLTAVGYSDVVNLAGGMLAVGDEPHQSG